VQKEWVLLLSRLHASPWTITKLNGSYQTWSKLKHGISKSWTGFRKIKFYFNNLVKFNSFLKKIKSSRIYTRKKKSKTIPNFFVEKWRNFAKKENTGPECTQILKVFFGCSSR
jgi:hypothetical protein